MHARARTLLHTKIVDTWEEVLADLERQRNAYAKSPQKGEEENANEMQIPEPPGTDFSPDWMAREKGR